MKTKKEIIESAIPYDPKAITGVYFLINRHNEIIYVGFSEDVMLRLKTHRYNYLTPYDRYFIIEVDNVVDGRNLEQAYIKRARPRLNVVYNNDLPVVPRTLYKSRRDDLGWLKEELDALEVSDKP